MLAIMTVSKTRLRLQIVKWDFKTEFRWQIVIKKVGKRRYNWIERKSANLCENRANCVLNGWFLFYNQLIRCIISAIYQILLVFLCIAVDVKLILGIKLNYRWLYLSIMRKWESHAVTKLTKINKNIFHRQGIV